MSTLSTDSRVPTFIQYEDEVNNEKKTKRKRVAAEGSKKPKTKRTKKDQVTPVVTDNSVNIWVGATVQKELGAYSIYFGENDHRNSTEVLQIEDVLQDDDYVTILGALKALEVSQGLEASINIYTSYRDLPRVAVGKRGSVVFPELVAKIKTLIADKKEGVTLQYVSGRTASPELSASVELATVAIRNQIEGVTTENEKNPVTQEASSQELALNETVVETTTEQFQNTEQDVSVNESIVEQVDVKSQDVEEKVDEEKVDTVNGGGVQQTIETADEQSAVVNNDTIAEAPMAGAEVTKITKVTTVVKETTVEISEEPVDTIMRDISSLSEMDVDSSNRKTQSDSQSCNSDLIQKDEEEEEEAPSSWSFGIRNVWDMLTSPFKSRK